MRHSSCCIALLLLFAVFTGCIREDLSDCSGHLLLAFHLDTRFGEDFPQKIHNVDVLIFDDATGRFVTGRRIEQSGPEDRSVQFTLLPGVYRVMAWANRNSGSRLSEFTAGKTLMTEGYIEMTAGGDSLYYAPALQEEEGDEESDDPYAAYRVRIPAGEGHTVKELFFARAYRSVNIFVRGLEDLPQAQGQAIEVEGLNLPSRYDLFLHALPEVHSHSSNLINTFTSGGTMPAARFLMPYAPVADDLSFELKNLPPIGVEVPPVYLRRYIEEHGITRLDDIDILIEFRLPGDGTGKASVYITLPDWDTLPVGPVY
jgi:hypothetical protein